MLDGTRLVTVSILSLAAFLLSSWVEATGIGPPSYPRDPAGSSVLGVRIVAAPAATACAWAPGGLLTESWVPDPVHAIDGSIDPRWRVLEGPWPPRSRQPETLGFTVHPGYRE